jgi:hypothetical protein
MPNRAAKLGSALIASLLASATVISMSPGETSAADECLSAPKETTPAGGHWYYRIEHPSNRHCWYVRNDAGATVKTAAAKPSALTRRSPNVATSAEMPGSVANARAELSDPKASLDQNTGSTASGQFPSAMPNSDTGVQAANSQATTSPPPASQSLTPADAAIAGSVVASRWPDQMGAIAPAASSPAASAPQAASSPPHAAPPPVANDVVADATPSLGTAQPSAKNNVRVAVADAAPEAPLEKPASTQMMFIVMIGAFSVAGLVASAVGLGGRRRKRVRLAQAKRRANWDAARTDRQRPSRFASTSEPRAASPSIAMAAQRPNIGLPLELREAQEELMWRQDDEERARETEPHPTQQHDAKVVDMLSRLARSAQV